MLLRGDKPDDCEKIRNLDFYIFHSRKIDNLISQYIVPTERFIFPIELVDKERKGLTWGDSEIV